MVLNYSVAFFMGSVLIISSHHLISCQPPETYVTNSSISWINSPSYVVNSTDGAKMTPILLREGNETLFVCGFLCDYNGTACVFGVLLFPKIYDSYLYYARLVWSANRNNPVRANATLQLRQDGGLFLMEPDGTLIWNTNTSGKVVGGFSLTVMGNLVLFDKSNDTIWQSFDHPTDSLVPGQNMPPVQKLISSTSATDWNEGVFTFDVKSSGLFAYIESNPRQFYYSKIITDESFRFPGVSYSVIVNDFFGKVILSVQFINARFMRFGSDGHLRAYNWIGSSWSEEADLLTDAIGECGYPTVCGDYSEDMQLHREEGVEMMKIAAWCLQSDYTKRPSMSLVVKVLEGLVAAEIDLDYTFRYPPMTTRIAEANQEREAVVGISLPFPSELSGPR